MAQAVIKFMEERPTYSGPSSELHSKLKPVAVTLGVDVERDTVWPKSARWLWRRIKEVLPLLVAAGIEARRAEDRDGSKITLRKMPTDDATNATEDENPTGEAETRGNTSGDDATSNATGESNATANATREPADRAENGNSGNSGIRYGDFSETPASLDARSGEDVTVADLKVRREIVSALRQLFEMHPETWKQTPKQIAEDLYIWMDLGYEPDLADVERALATVAGK